MIYVAVKFPWGEGLHKILTDVRCSANNRGRVKYATDRRERGNELSLSSPMAV